MRCHMMVTTRPMVYKICNIAWNTVTAIALFVDPWLPRLGATKDTLSRVPRWTPFHWKNHKTEKKKHETEDSKNPANQIPGSPE